MMQTPETPDLLPWKFCPECGCKDYKRADWNNENECIECKQSWFPDVDYTDVVRGHLKNSQPNRYTRAAPLPDDKAVALDEDKEQALKLANCFIIIMELDGTAEKEPHKIRPWYIIRAALQRPDEGELVKALEFYADRGNLNSMGGYVDDQSNLDGGSIARETLAAHKAKTQAQKIPCPADSSQNEEY